MSIAYFLVAHGSRDPRPQWALEQIAVQLRLRLSRTHPALIGTGVLECSPLSLSQQLQQFATQVRFAGVREIQILPLFLLPGVHVKDDIPVEVATAQQIVGSDMTLQVLPFLGSHIESMAKILTAQMQRHEVETWILIAHGSRRLGGNQPIEKLAEILKVTPAYWSVSPSLSAQTETLIQRHSTQIGILPYFLFSGGITDAIAASLQHLKQQFSSVQFKFSPTLDQTPTFVNFIQTLLNSTSYQWAEKKPDAAKQ